MRVPLLSLLSGLALASKNAWYPLDEQEIILHCAKTMALSPDDQYNAFEQVNFSKHWSYYSDNPFCRIMWGVHGQHIIKYLDIKTLLKNDENVFEHLKRLDVDPRNVSGWSNILISDLKRGKKALQNKKSFLGGSSRETHQGIFQKISRSVVLQSGCRNTRYMLMKYPKYFQTFGCI